METAVRFPQSFVITFSKSLLKFEHCGFFVYICKNKMTQGTKWILEPNLDEFLKSSHTEFNWLTSSKMATMETPKSIFDVFFKKCQQYHESPAHTLQEIKHV